MRSHSRGPLHTQLPSSSGGKLTVYGEDRRCAQPGCITKLSRYTAGPLCSVHATRPGMDARRTR